MARAQETFNKKEVRNKKEKKRKEKLARKLAKKDEETKGSMDDMMVYLDDDGNFTTTPPDPTAKRKEYDSSSIEISIPKLADKEAIDPVRKGTVSFFDSSKGFGFIKDSETQESVFVHINNVIDEIKEGNLVSFEVEMGQRGPSAIKVTQIK
jgi:cold shock CspA family protein